MRCVVKREDGETACVVTDDRDASSREPHFMIWQQGDARDAWTFYNARDLRGLRDAITKLLDAAKP